MTLDELRIAIAAQGLAWRGAFHPGAADLPVGAEIGTLVLVGFTGRENWPFFASSPEAADGKANPLNRWSRRIVSAVAARFGATAIFPFDGPPWAPFQRWAQKAEPVYPSPLGMLIHPDWGLWHAWRGALAFTQLLELPQPDRRTSPCESCAEKPCLTACPVNAFFQPDMMSRPASPISTVWKAPTAEITAVAPAAPVPWERSIATRPIRRSSICRRSARHSADPNDQSAQSSTIVWSAFNPSVRQAGPGCRIIEDLIS